MPAELAPYLRRLEKLGLHAAAQAFQALESKLQSEGTLPQVLPVPERGAKRLETINELLRSFIKSPELSDKIMASVYG